MNEAKFLQKRYSHNRMLKAAGIIAISISCLFLAIILGSIIKQASGALTSYQVKVKLPEAPITSIAQADKFLDEFIPLSANNMSFFSISASEKLVGERLIGGEAWLPASAKLNDILAGHADITQIDPESLKLIDAWRNSNSTRQVLNFSFFTNKESRNPENAGILTSLIGTLYTMMVCILVSIPIALCAAIYLEEFAPKNLLTSFIEININNLAAVPSIVFGLLALAILINVFGLPRSASITAGLTLAMMSIPTLIMTARAAFKTVPTTIKHAALALGATKIQVIFHHTLPLATPGIATGIILTMARAIGETAPFILIGMVAFIVDLPHGIFEPATVLPVQIYLWSSSPEHAFKAKTAAAILFLLSILILINMIAVYIRKKHENRW